MYTSRILLLFIYLPIAVIILLITKYVLDRITINQKGQVILKLIFGIFVLSNIIFFIWANINFFNLLSSIVFRDLIILIDLSVLMVVAGIKLMKDNPNDSWKRGLGIVFIAFPISMIIFLTIDSPCCVS